MDKIKVIYLVNSLGMGGSEKQLFYLVKKLNKRFKVLIIKLNNSTDFYDSKIKALGIEIYKYNLSNGLFSFSSIEQIFKIRSLIVKYQPHLIHSWLFYPNFVNFLLRLISINYKMIVSKRGSNFWYSKKHFYINKLVYKMSDFIITNSESLKNEILYYNNVNDKINIINNAIEVNDKIYRKKINVNRINIGCIGRIVREKRYEDVLEAAYILRKKYKNIYFIIIGGRGNFESFEKLVINKRMKNYFFLKGEQEDIDEYIRDFDIFLMASSSEGMPNSIMESMNYGKPIVATRVGAIPELVINNKNGILVDPCSPLQIVDAISKLIDNKKKMAQFGENSYEMIKKMTVENMVKKVEKIYLDSK